jgi:hypothetical protein
MYCDEWVGISDRGIDIAEPSEEAIGAAIDALDGERKTMVTLYGPGEEYLVVSGGSDGRFVVYATRDNQSFVVAINPAVVDKSSKVLLYIGGQEGDYPLRHVIGLAEALAAARSFAATGSLNESIHWENSQ